MPQAPEPRRPALRGLATRLGHEFRDPTLLERALVHSSMGNAGKASYERLEFLGDAILGFVVAEHLFRLQPEIPEGELTDRRARIVSREPLAEVGRSLKLQDAVEVGRGIRSEELQNARLLADLVEAVLGAIYLDGGIRAAKRFVKTHVLDHVPGTATAVAKPRDPKSQLLHWAQARGLGQPTYALREATGPDHARTFTVAVRLGEEDLGEGADRTKRAAEMAAAEAALEALRARGETGADRDAQ